MQALIFAAGLGTRLKPLTDTVPKALLPIGNRDGSAPKPMLERLLVKLYKQGFDRIVINVHHLADQVEAFCHQFLKQHPDWKLTITFSDERALLLETGGGIKKAASLLSPQEPFLVHNVDIVSNLDAYTFYRIHCANALAAERNGRPLLASLLVSDRETARYFLFDDYGALVGWTNVKTGEVRSPYAHLDVAACHKKAFAGVHVISPSIFALMEGWPDAFSIVDFYLANAKNHLIMAYEMSQLDIIDVGKPETIKLLN